MNATMKFSDMPQGWRDAALAWANSHDWGGKDAHWHEDDSALLVAYCAAKDDCGDWYQERETFRTMKELRDWAGY